MINNYKNLTAIVKGHIKSLFGADEVLYKERIAICHTCPLYNKGNGILPEHCNNKKLSKIIPDEELIANFFTYIKEEGISYETLSTGTYLSLQQEGYLLGCGCHLSAKSRSQENNCPLNKWRLLDQIKSVIQFVRENKISSNKIELTYNQILAMFIAHYLYKHIHIAYIHLFDNIEGVQLSRIFDLLETGLAQLLNNGSLSEDYLKELKILL
jgi:hypothetical protein